MVHLSRTTIIVAIALSSTVGCKKVLGLFGKGQPEPTPSASATTEAPAAAAGTSVTIPAGTLIAGTPCDGFPKITTEELPGTAVQLGEFTIDALPYPNDPTKAPVTNVSRDEAAQMCTTAGKRLCTELEWERACKGAGNLEYEYGKAYQAAACATIAVGPGTMGTRAQCQSAFGVKDMHGLVWEWTDSPWGRGSVGGLVTVRGGSAQAGEVVGRCANGVGKAPTEKQPSIGFRCCSGTKNTPEVNLALQKQPPLVAEPAVDAALVQRLMAALPKDVRTPTNATVAFEKIWRWHPRANEEVVIGRFVVKPTVATEKTKYRAMAFKVCGNGATYFAGLRGPVEQLGDPATGTDPARASMSVAGGGKTGNASFGYGYGRVGVDQPNWIVGKEAADAGAPAVDAGAAAVPVATPIAVADAAPATAPHDAGVRPPVTHRPPR
jgi:hypothetical protein